MKTEIDNTAAICTEAVEDGLSVWSDEVVLVQTMVMDLKKKVEDLKEKKHSDHRGD